MTSLRELPAAIWRLLVPPLFVIDVRDGVARVRRGVAPPGLLSEFSEVGRAFGLAEGTIYGVRARHGVTLDFSAQIPAEAHQRFRNVLSVHRHRIKDA